MATGLTPTYNLPYPQASDPVDVHGDIKDLAEQVEDILEIKADTSLANTWTNNNVFEVTSSLPPIKIVQNGSGDAFLVEDSSSPDLTPFVINNTGNVGIGKQTASEKLDVAGNIQLSGNVIFEGTTDNSYETSLSVDDPTEDRSIVLPNISGTVITSGNLHDITDLGTLIAPIVFEGSTADDFEVTLSPGDPTSDITVTLPDASGIVLTTGNPLDITATGTISSGVWNGTEVPISHGGTGSTTASGAINALVPTQTSNSGKYLKTDGSVVSWSSVDALPSQSSHTGEFLTTDGSVASWTSLVGLPSQATHAGEFLTTNGTSASWTTITLIPSLSGNNGKYLTTDGSSVSWSSIPGGYTAPQLGNTILTSGSLITTVDGLILTSGYIHTPFLSLSTTTSVNEGRIAWDATNDKIIIGDGVTTKEFASSTLKTNVQGSSYDIVLTDKDKLIEMPNGGTLTIPANTIVDFPVGTQITILQTGVSQVTIAGATSPSLVTVNGTPGLKLRAQWSSATIIKRDANTWVAIGDLVA